MTNDIHDNQIGANFGYYLAKVGVEGSNPFARSNFRLPGPYMVCTKDVGDKLGPSGRRCLAR